MRITTTRGPVTVLAVAGEIDGETFPQLIAEADNSFEAGHARLVLDLSDVSYISSGGLVALQTILGRTVARGGNLAVCGVTQRVRKVLETTGFDQRLSILPDRAAAIASLG